MKKCKSNQMGFERLLPGVCSGRSNRPAWGLRANSRELLPASNQLMHMSVEWISFVNASHPVLTKAVCQQQETTRLAKITVCVCPRTNHQTASLAEITPGQTALRSVCKSSWRRSSHPSRFCLTRSRLPSNTSQQETEWMKQWWKRFPTATFI